MMGGLGGYRERADVLIEDSSVDAIKLLASGAVSHNLMPSTRMALGIPQ
jgi:hypothetical protein